MMVVTQIVLELGSMVMFGDVGEKGTVRTIGDAFGSSVIGSNTVDIV